MLVTRPYACSLVIFTGCDRKFKSDVQPEEVDYDARLEIDTLTCKRHLSTIRSTWYSASLKHRIIS